MIKDSDAEMKPYWWQAAPPRPAPQQDWQQQTEIVIIGAGFTGLAAALTLARAGRKVVIVEKQLIGEGAASRNGGITSGNLRVSEAGLARRFGREKARRFTDEAVAARADLQRFIETEGIDCDYQRCGRVVGITKAVSLENLQREADSFAERYAIQPTVISGSGIADYIDSNKYQAAVLRPDIGGIHPAKLAHAMADLVLAEGVAIYTETAVSGIRRDGTRFTIATNQGRIEADHVIAATNAYTDRSLPWLKRRLVPVISEMIATEELGENRVRSLMPKLTMFGEALELGYYYRPSPDGKRILLGGRRLHNDPEQARLRLRQGLGSILPQLAETEISHHWHGFVAFPFDQLPKLAVHDGVIYPAGFSGSGTVWARWLGHKAAAMILGRDGETVFADMAMPTLPFYTGEPWFLPLAMRYYRLRDRLSARSK